MHSSFAQDLFEDFFLMCVNFILLFCQVLKFCNSIFRLGQDLKFPILLQNFFQEHIFY